MTDLCKDTVWEPICKFWVESLIFIFILSTSFTYFQPLVLDETGSIHRKQVSVTHQKCITYSWRPVTHSWDMRIYYVTVIKKVTSPDCLGGWRWSSPRRWWAHEEALQSCAESRTTAESSRCAWRPERDPRLLKHTEYDIHSFRDTKNIIRKWSPFKISVQADV